MDLSVLLPLQLSYLIANAGNSHTLWTWDFVLWTLAFGKAKGR